MRNMPNISQLFQLVPVGSIKGVIQRNSRTLLVVLVGIILVDSFFLNVSSDVVTFGVLLFYGIIANVGRLRSRETFLLCLGLLGAMFMSFVFSYASIPTEKLAVWLFLFMLVGIIQAWRE